MMKKVKTDKPAETVIHGIFFLLGLVAVGCVLLITVYLVIAGIPAIRKSG
jgi:phosphate transport system permease protein